MTFIILKMIDAFAVGNDPKQVLRDLPGEFDSPLYAVRCLAQGKAEERNGENALLALEDRQWTWRDENFRFAESRAKSMPGCKKKEFFF